MRVAITSSDTQNAYAALIALALADAGYRPVAFLINSSTKLQQLVRYARFYGWYRALLRVLHPPTSPHTLDYILDYLGSHHLKAKHLSIAGISKSHNIRLIYGKFHNPTLQYFVHNNIDVIINAGGGLFPKKLIDAPRLGIINIHMGHLPDFRGIHTFEWSLWYNKPLEVVSHWISTKIDAGDILQRQTFVPHRVTSISDLKDQSVSVRIDLLLNTVRQLNARSISSIPQDASLGKQYYAMHPYLQSLLEKWLRTIKQP